MKEPSVETLSRWKSSLGETGRALPDRAGLVQVGVKIPEGIFVFSGNGCDLSYGTGAAAFVRAVHSDTFLCFLCRGVRHQFL